MTLLKIDETKCKKDGFCVRECPAGIIRQKDKDSVPQMIPGADQNCMLCGHCIAVCPHDALQHTLIPMENSPRILEENTVTPEQAIQFLRSRRSVRRFKKKPVEKEMIQFLIDHARYAPTGGNTQLLKWTVFTDEAKIKAMADMTVDWMRQMIASGNGDKMAAYIPRVIAAYDAGVNSITRDAPCLVFASAPEKYANAMVDLTIALSYFELMATAKGMGTCWLGLITMALKQHEPLKELVGLPKSHTQFYPMILGYPTVKYYRVPERKPAHIIWK
ncbi:MAG: nitroreductase family protein [Proteobacteria bacterium]|nr:nitroreductase family protein [Pseudomonadota bacterium]MBU1389332.1 nitroreductase family protein [Pseudomonadota bacterium]MBU1544152.1 nitroreductase family protein [Pseudomonadota bacterium]MBU2430230.1 nitroreductase family protein [Pseudomonadota bacterium]MBU2482711.1 nitroreductase family protein [Pseudomonadota bacterium]